MAYEKYTTDALVLGSFERGEADKTLVLYTHAHGLIYARCSGMRKEHSRMRYALQDYSCASVSLVRGKSGWRVAGAHEQLCATGKPHAGLIIFARIARLLRRLVHGEEAHPYLFDTLKRAHTALLTDAKQQELVELVCVARMLHALGYLSAEGMGTALFAHTSYKMADIHGASEKRKALIRSINEAITESQL